MKTLDSPLADKNQSALRPHNVGLGILLVLVSTMFTSAQEAVIKLSSSEMSISQMFVLRSVLLIPVLVVIAIIMGSKSRSWKFAFHFWPTVRSLMFIGMYLTVYSVLPILPLAVVGAGIYTAPLFVAALSFILLGEPVGIRGFLAILLGFAGVLVVLQPGSEAFTWALVVPVSGGLFYALSALITRSKCQEYSAAEMAMSLAVTLLIAGLVSSAAIFLLAPSGPALTASPFLFGQWSFLGAAGWIAIIVLTLLMAGNGLVLPAAYKAAPTVIVATFDYCYLIFATLFGLILFAEFPTASTLVGMVMIASAGILIATGKTHFAR